jgi:hypothetical protein
MLSNKYLEYQNKKTRLTIVEGMGKKDFVDYARAFVIKLYKGVQILERSIDDESFTVVPPELDYTLD